MASNAWWAYGSEFQVKDGSDGSAWMAVAEIIDITGPNMSMESIDITNQDGTAGWRDFTPGWRDAGEVSISANWLPAHETQGDGTAVSEAEGIFQSFEDDNIHSFQIVTEGDGSAGTITIGMTGIITSFNTALPLTEQAKLDFTVKLTGAVTFT